MVYLRHCAVMKTGFPKFMGEGVQGMYYIEKIFYFRGKVSFVSLFTFLQKNAFQPMNSSFTSSF